MPRHAYKPCTKNTTLGGSCFIHRNPLNIQIKSNNNNVQLRDFCHLALNFREPNDSVLDK
ncbi:hypothetical protein [Moraxella lacunata]|uniref:hypothetical protein n=1 Tax=Moraxella lacunata TaxID=477 RepID=UPI003EE015B6